MLLCETYINQSVVALAADETQVSRTYLFFDLERRYEEFRRISDGHSSRGSLTTRLLGGLPIVVPERRVIEAFDALAKPLTSRIATALRENQSLVALRDALLPKLLSGEVRVNDGESILSGPA
jgi:type I restriction enzyme S subunit